MKKIFTLILTFVLMLSLTACKDTFSGDQKHDAYAFVTTSTGMSYTEQAETYRNSSRTAHALAIKHPYHLYLNDGDTATIVFACTACEHSETIEDVTAPDAFFFECDCVTGDEHPDMTEALVINIILGSPPAEEG